MKTHRILILAVGAMLLGSSAQADRFRFSVRGDGFALSIGSGHRPARHGFRAHRFEHSRHVVQATHVCYSHPVVEEVWVPAVCQNVIIGYDRYGRPVVETRIARPGYYVRRIVRYETCAHLH